MDKFFGKKRILDLTPKERVLLYMQLMKRTQANERRITNFQNRVENKHARKEAREAMKAKKATRAAGDAPADDEDD